MPRGNFKSQENCNRKGENNKEFVEHFHYVFWPNYTHEIIEHDQELIEWPNGPGIVVGLSGEGKEGKIEYFAIFGNIWQDNTHGEIRDALSL